MNEVKLYWLLLCNHLKAKITNGLQKPLFQEYLINGILKPLMSYLFTYVSYIILFGLPDQKRNYDSSLNSFWALNYSASSQTFFVVLGVRGSQRYHFMVKCPIHKTYKKQNYKLKEIEYIKKVTSTTYVMYAKHKRYMQRKKSLKKTNFMTKYN